MTIAAGFHCKDGVLLCADTQMTVPWLLKYPESKMGMLTKDIKNPLFFVYAGQKEFSHMCFSRLSNAATKAEKENQDFEDVLAEECVRIHERFYPLYSDPNRQLELSLLIARHKKEEQKVDLYEVYGPSLARVSRYECIGTGMSLTKAIASDLYSPTMTLREAFSMAVYILGLTKTHIDGCGGESQIMLIHEKDGYLRWWDLFGQLDDLEIAFAEFRKIIRPLLLAYGNWIESGAEKEFLENLKDAVRKIKEQRKRMRRKYRLLVEKMTENLTGVQELPEDDVSDQ